MILASFELCFEFRLPSSNVGTPRKALSMEKYLRVKVILNAGSTLVEVVEMRIQIFHLPLSSPSFSPYFIIPDPFAHPTFSRSYAGLPWSCISAEMIATFSTSPRVTPSAVSDFREPRYVHCYSLGARRR